MIFPRFPSHLLKNLFPINLAFSALTWFVAVTPVAILRSSKLSLNGFPPPRNSINFVISSISRQILTAVVSSCCSLVTYSTPAKPYITLLIFSAVTGVDNKQTSLCVSEKPLPIVNSIVAFTLRIKTSAIIRSDDSPAQNRSERRTTCGPFLKAKNTSGCSRSSFQVSWRYSLKDLVHKLCSEAAKYGSIALQLLRCSNQFPVLSTL